MLGKQLDIVSTADLIAVSTPPFGRLANFINAEGPTELGRTQDATELGCARHPSQLYEAGLEGIMLLIVLLFIALRGGFKKPGLLTGVFALGYGASRFLVEYFRVPDSQFFSPTNPYGFAVKFSDYGITMGQCLSLPMIFFGLFLCIRCARQQENIY